MCDIAHHENLNGVRALELNCPNCTMNKKTNVLKICKKTVDIIIIIVFSFQNIMNVLSLVPAIKTCCYFKVHID